MFSSIYKTENFLNKQIFVQKIENVNSKHMFS